MIVSTHKDNRMQSMIALIILVLFSSFPGSGQDIPRSAGLLGYAMESVNKGEYQVARQTLDKLLEEDQRNADAHFLKAYCLYKEEQHEKALPELDKVIAVNPKYTNAYIIRARVNRALGNYWSALGDYNRARRLDPHLTFFSITRGMLQE